MEFYIALAIDLPCGEGSFSSGDARLNLLRGDPKYARKGVGFFSQALIFNKGEGRGTRVTLDCRRVNPIFTPLTPPLPLTVVLVGQIPRE